MSSSNFDQWPESLIEEFVHRRAIVFIGAGASASSVTSSNLRPPSWEKLLIELSGSIDVKSQKSVKRLLGKEKYLDAAQIICDEVAKPDFKRKIDQHLKRPNYLPSEVHQAIFDIDPKIVITTNYDEIYDNYCKAHSPDNAHNICKYYEGHTLNDVRSSTRCIFKAHGCVTDPTKIVLSRSQYFTARRDHPAFFEVLHSLMLVSTVLFVGCGLSDPDIQIILENVNLSAPSDHPHYALVLKGRHQSEKKSYLETYNIKLLEYKKNQTDTHLYAVDALKDLKTQVLNVRRDKKIP